MIHRHLRKRIEKVIYADDATEDVGLLLKLRLPWLLAGLAIGTLMTLVVSSFEEVLDREVSLAFFIPIIVYMSGAVATQTETIYIRNLGKKQAKFSIYLFKELVIGMIIGLLCGGFLAGASWLWLGSANVAWTIGIAMFISISVATILALLVPTFLHKLKMDPALGAGPFTTVLQDLLSIIIYFAVAGAIIL